MRTVLILLFVAATSFAQGNARQRREKGVRAMDAGLDRNFDRGLKGSSSSKGTTVSPTGGQPQPIPKGPTGNGGGGVGSTAGGSVGGCKSTVADAITNVQGSIVLTPTRCCNHNGPTAAIITHAMWDEQTSTGLEPFWNTFYSMTDEYMAASGTCFVMSGFNQTAAEQHKKTLGEVLVQVNALVALLPSVPAIMSTDPTNDMKLVNLFRVITDTAGGPSIGVFNSGFAKINEESVVTGQDRLPYIGYTSEDDYGTEAASITLQLLKGQTPVPLCFNGRPDLPFVGRRCASYYNALTNGNPPTRYYGVTCRADSSVDALLALMVNDKVNAVFSHVDCCQPVAEAAMRAKQEYNQTIVVGCQDDSESAPSGSVDFVTAQPIELQAYQVTSWVNLPVEDASEGVDNGRANELFPSPTSFLNTAIYNIVIF
jgi:hypothetical protein